jgi:hypothetical protein
MGGRGKNGAEDKRKEEGKIRKEKKAVQSVRMGKEDKRKEGK